MDEKKYLPCFADLIDRLSINLLKEVKILETKEQIIGETFNILHDLDIDIKNKKIDLTADLIHTIIIIAQINNHIWVNESDARQGKKQDLDKLVLTHSLNGIRMNAKNKLQHEIGEKDMDKKIDCLAAKIPERFKNWIYKYRK